MVRCVPMSGNVKDMHAAPTGVVASELTLMGAVEKVAFPWSGNEWLCPQCEQTIPPLRLQFRGKPPKYAHVLHDVIRCCWCKFSSRRNSSSWRRWFSIYNSRS